MLLIACIHAPIVVGNTFSAHPLRLLTAQANIEATIWTQETSYLEDTAASGGNILKVSHARQSVLCPMVFHSATHADPRLLA
jgi:hypothetical protein